MHSEPRRCIRRIRLTRSGREALLAQAGGPGRRRPRAPGARPSIPAAPTRTPTLRLSAQLTSSAAQDRAEDALTARMQRRRQRRRPNQHFNVRECVPVPHSGNHLLANHPHTHKIHTQT